MAARYLADISTGTAIKVNDDGTYAGQAIRFKYCDGEQYSYTYRFETPVTMMEKIMMESIIEDAFPKQKSKLMDLLLPGF
jgi:hypothetical protein